MNDELLTRGVHTVLVKEDCEAKLQRKKPLRIKFGIDPTGSRLHIGRAVPLRKLREFQSLGHTIVLIIGDFTGIVGDASDKDTERPMLSREQVQENMRNYTAYLGKILDIEKCEIHYNSSWLSKLDFYDISRLAQNFSVSEMLDRDNFSKRHKAGKRISLHEFLYPLMQGYDSVAIQSDIEIGGSDQLFNVLAGRTLQKSFDQEPQNVITLNILEGTDGRKMSTSWGNTIYLDDEPQEMFGKIMSIPDTLLFNYFELCTDEPLQQVQQWITENPRDAKARLAKNIIAFYHSQEEADGAEQDFITKFVKKETPDTMPLFVTTENQIGILDLLTQVCGFTASNSEARRLVTGGGVSIDGEKIENPQLLVLISNTPKVIKAGKRNWGRVQLEE